MITYWSILLALSVLIYVLLDGLDLGVGMLFGATTDEDRRRAMLASIAPIWDGNETWLVVAGVLLWGAFPLVYATLLPAFYLPVCIMLAGLIFRGVSFEFRIHARSSRVVWDLGLILGSLVATFMQGAMVGALAQGIPVENGRFVGSVMTWLTPFSALSGVALCFGYMLLGAGWLAKKCEGDVRTAAFVALPRLLIVVLVLLAALFFHALHQDFQVMGRWLDRPVLFVVPLAGAFASLCVWRGARGKSERYVFSGAAALFIVGYAMFAISFWPYIVPFAITINDAAAPMSSLWFMFWGAGLFVFPLMLLYTFSSYRIFKGKVDVSSEHY